MSYGLWITFPRMDVEGAEAENARGMEFIEGGFDTLHDALESFAQTGWEEPDHVLLGTVAMVIDQTTNCPVCTILYFPGDTDSKHPVMFATDLEGCQTKRIQEEYYINLE